MIFNWKELFGEGKAHYGESQDKLFSVFEKFSSAVEFKVKFE